MNANLKGGLVLLLVFLLGGVTGGAAMRFMGGRRIRAMLEQPGNARQHFFMLGLEREVHLEKDQREKVRSILHEREVELKEANRECAPRVKKVRKQTLEQVRGLMHPEQLPGFDRFANDADQIYRASTGDPIGEVPR